MISGFRFCALFATVHEISSYVQANPIHHVRREAAVPHNGLGHSPELSHTELSHLTPHTCSDIILLHQHRSHKARLFEPLEEEVLGTHTRNQTSAGAAKSCSLKFLHIPKNAGSSVEAWGKELGQAWGFYWESCDVKVGGSYCPVPHVPPSMLKSLLAKHRTLRAHLTDPYVNSENVFCVKRNPYDKLVSEYGWRLSEFQRMSKREFKASLAEVGGESEEVQVCPGCKKFQPCSAAGMNFFLKHVLSSIKHKRVAATVDRCHFLPQMEYMLAGSRQTCKHVLDVDNLQEDFAKLMASEGCDVPQSYAHMNDAECDNLTSAHLEPETKALIQVIYKDDFVKLGYAM